ncbi:MAG: hypothetical protein IJT94_05955 [Oscillibacter sp.]|nr:hypothetical protein [Oscillibacter sp.]
MERYYIGGKQYIPEESTVLCAHVGIMERATLYHTSGGAFFIVESDTDGGTPAVRVLDRAAALSFMDAHPAEIDTNAYNAVFGEPERA